MVAGATVCRKCEWQCKQWFKAAGAGKSGTEMEEQLEINVLRKCPCFDTFWPRPILRDFRC